MPVVVEKETTTPAMTALEESTKVAVSVAAVALSVKMKFVDVPNAITLAGAAGGVTGVVLDGVVLDELSLQPASTTSSVANRNGTDSLVMVLLKK